MAASPICLMCWVEAELFKIHVRNRTKRRNYWSRQQSQVTNLGGNGPSATLTFVSTPLARQSAKCSEPKRARCTRRSVTKLNFYRAFPRRAWGQAAQRTRAGSHQGDDRHQGGHTRGGEQPTQGAAHAAELCRRHGNAPDQSRARNQGLQEQGGGDSTPGPRARSGNSRYDTRSIRAPDSPSRCCSTPANAAAMSLNSVGNI